MEKLILDRIKNYNSKIDELFKKIDEFDRIAIFRHDHPDYDALGSQMAMVNFIKDNYKNKEVVFLGDDHITMSGKCFPRMQEINDEWFSKPFLSIILDLSTIDRVADDRALKGECIIKIDHHPEVDDYSKLSIVDTTMIAAGELLAAIFLSRDNLVISKETAKYLFKAIVGDSGRFLYSDTSELTFLVAQKLLSTGFNLNETYKEMYDEGRGNLDVRKYILKNYKVTKNGVAYYILRDKQLKKFGLDPIQGKDNINMFAHLEGIKIWMSITEDIKKGHWRVSVRSSEIPIDKTLEKFNGGGHAQASATKLKNLSDVKKLIEELNKLAM